MDNLTAAPTTIPALVGEVIEPKPPVCSGCFVSLAVDVDGVGEAPVDGQHFGCYVPAMSPAGATEDYLVASPAAKVVNAIPGGSRQQRLIGRAR